ncbi:MAG TPA: hypothetical protein VJZ75_03005, partial [Candidatus Bathyarchaeia archaeon]|nr:hypothetical protein [Candidatus Bathyarchaeia archaeon]
SEILDSLSNKLSIKKSNIIVSIIIVVASVGALFGLSYQAPTTTILTETEYQTHAQQFVFQAQSTYYYTNVARYLEAACAEWVYNQMTCTTTNGNVNAALTWAEAFCTAFMSSNYDVSDCVYAERSISVTYSRPVGTTSFYITENIPEVSTTILSTTIPFATLSTKAPPIYMSALRMSQTNFTYVAFLVHRRCWIGSPNRISKEEKL